MDLWLLEARPRVRQVTIITRFRWFSKSFAKSDYKLISFYTLCHLVDITMLINKFGLSLGGGSESHYQWRGLLRNYMRDNALCIVAVDFDTKSCKTSSATDGWCWRSKQTIRAAKCSKFERSSEWNQRKIVVLQNNVQVMLNEFEKIIREVHA